MAYSNDQLNDIYDRTSGYCHICHKKLAFNNYGVVGARGAWEVEHSKPKAKGGSNHPNNLYAACILCNREKNSGSTKTARAKYGNRKAPLSARKRRETKAKNAVGGGVIGGIIGSLAGPVGTVIGSVIGAKIEYDEDPDR